MSENERLMERLERMERISNRKLDAILYGIRYIINDTKTIESKEYLNKEIKRIFEL